jgi:hypothetical protein
MFSREITTILGFNGIDPSKVEKIIGKDDDNYFRVMVGGRIYRLMYTNIQYPTKLSKIVSENDFKIKKEDLTVDINYDLISKDMKITYIISYRENDGYRKRNLEAVLNYISKIEIKNFEILLIEQDVTEKFDCSKFPKVKKIFLYNPNVFNKGWGYNVGALNAKGNYLIFGDSDIILPYIYFISSLNMFKDYDVIDPYSKVIYYNDYITQYMVNNNFKMHNPTSDKEILSYVISGGMFMIRKKRFLDILGFDEDCYGYGHEDDIFDNKLKIMEYKIIKMSTQFCYHLYHPQSNSIYYNNVINNNKLFLEYRNYNKTDLLKKIKSTKSVGDIKKYI